MISTNNTIETDSFTEEVKTYMTYKVANIIATYWFPVLVPSRTVL